MNWFKNSKQRMEGFTQAIIRYPLTTGLFILSVALTVITIRTSGQRDYYVEVLACIVGAISAATAQAFYERFFRKNVVIRWIMYGGTLLFSIAYYFFYLSRADLGYNQAASIRTAVLLFSLFIGFIWAPSIRHVVTFSNSFVANFKAYFVTLLLSVVLVLGTYSVLGTFNFLIMSIDYRLYVYFASIVFQFFAPIYFLSLIPVYPLPETSEDDEMYSDKTAADRISVPKVLEILLSYIIIPLIVAFTLILLLYIVSNITGEFWNDNALEPMLVSYAVTGWITLFLVESVDNKSSTLFRKHFPKLLLIVVSFQTVSSILRINTFGITHGRYYVILFGVFSILSSTLYSFFKTRKNTIPGLLILFSIISIIPPIDAMTVGLNSQISRLEQTLAENNMLENSTLSPDGTISDEEKQKIADSLDYINRRNAVDELEWLPTDFNIYADFESYFGFNRITYDEYGSEDTEANPTSFEVSLADSETVVLDIEQSDHMVSFNTSQYNDTENTDNQLSFTLDSLNYTLEWTRTEDEIILDLSDEMDENMVTFDISGLLDEYGYSFNPHNLELDELSFTEENDNILATLVVKHMQTTQDGYLDGEFILLITLK